MSPKYSIHQKDKCQDAIVETLEAYGAVTQHLGRPLDRLVFYWGITALAEFKSGNAKLREGQKNFIRDWPGEVAVLRTPDDAVRWLKYLREGCLGQFREAA